MVNKTRTGERLQLLQEREVHQILQPWLAAHGSTFSVASNVESIALRELEELGHNAQRSSDKALSAFAQLATLRLNVRRAMVSLIDTKHQYILTEATKSQSFLSDRPTSKHDELWLGTSILQRNDAVCHHCFDNQYEAEDDEGNVYRTKALVVPDCRLDDRFSTRTYVVSEPGVRFYAGVPITSRNGYHIGVYAVSDEAPRDGLSVEDLKFMEDVAVAIMEHFEWARDRVDRYKGERLIRGLAGFISPTARQHHQKQQNLREKARLASDARLGRARTELPSDFAADHAPGRRIVDLSGHDAVNSDSSDNDVGHEHAGPDSHRPQSNGQDASDDTARVLERAARSVRRCALADGVIFFDARSDGDNVEKERPDDAEVITLSLKIRSDARITSQATLRKTTLRQYFEHFPSGRAFDFTVSGGEIDGSICPEDGCCDESDLLDGGEAGTKRRPTKSQDIFHSHKEILAQLPGLRKLIFLPLTDFMTGQDIAGCFLWTNALGRVMNMEDDLPHLNAFANIIVSEVVRTQSEQLSKSKTAFIASMSHELRSPLHGILGSVELLEDTATDTYQHSLLSSIANCSKTLLDTLSNLLSYAKVTQTRIVAALEPVDLALLVEEVVEAVCAGNSYRQEHSSAITALPNHHSPDMLQHDRRAARKRSATMSVSSGFGDKTTNVNVLIDVMGGTSWVYKTNPGALRRIVLNLLGNALKYTTKGVICVALRKISVRGKECISLEVADTGKGISDSFLKNNLFRAFKQEDQASSGTGLGLSIVKQLAESLGGTIDVTSVVDKGTEFHVHLPLEVTDPMPDLARIESADPLLDTDLRTRGMSIRIVDPDEHEFEATSVGAARLRHNLGHLCASWFDMNVVKPGSRSRKDLDFLMVTRPANLKLVLERSGTSADHLPKAMIIVCSSAAEASVMGQELAGANQVDCIVEFVTQPCGPRKLARIFMRCLQGIKDPRAFIADRDANTLTAALPQISPLPPPSMTFQDFRSAINAGELDKTKAGPDQKRILVVDDNKVNLDLMTKFVAKHHVPPATATNGLEALQAYAESLERGEQFDWVLIDISMPVMDGLEASREIRKVEERHGAPKARIVALTGHSTEEMQQRAADEGSGVDVFLNKPIRFEVLRQILEKDFG